MSEAPSPDAEGKAYTEWWNSLTPEQQAKDAADRQALLNEMQSALDALKPTYQFPTKDAMNLYESTVSKVPADAVVYIGGARIR